MTTTRAKDPRIVAESQKIFGVIGKVFLGLLILFLILAAVRWGQKKTKEAEAAAKQRSAVQAATPSARAEQWQLCWEKIPGHTGTTNTRQLCLSTRILRGNASLVLTYPYRDGSGTMEASSSDGLVYEGLWKDPGGWGNFHLRFTSPTSAVGWVDEKGKKPINLWLSSSPK